MKRIFATVVLCSMSMTASAGELRRVLVPSVATGQPGAFGSIWKSELWLHSTAESPRELRIPLVCFALCDPTRRVIAPGQSDEVPLFPQPGATGVIGYTDATAAELTFSLRVQDISRQALTWGTHVPVVRDDELRSRLNLLPIPVSDRFRSMLRIYAFDGAARTAVRIRAHTAADVTPRTLAEHVVELEPPPPAQFPEAGLQFKPWYVQLDVESLFPEAAGQRVIGIEVTPVSSDLRIWGFISTTNDETQHVTVLLP